MKYKVILRKGTKSLQPKFYNQEAKAKYTADKFVIRGRTSAKVYELRKNKRRLIYEAGRFMFPTIDAMDPGGSGGPA